MAKLSQKELQAYAELGYIPEPYRVYGVAMENPEVSAALESLRYRSKQERLAPYIRGILGEEETAANVDVYVDNILDDDNQFRKYKIWKDKNSGEIINKILYDDVDGIDIQDVIEGKVPSPAYESYREQELLKKIYANIDPETDEFRNDIGKSWLQNTFDNTMAWSAIDKLIGGETAKQLSDNITSNIKFEGNNILYHGAKINVPPDFAEDFNEWLNKKYSYQADGFLDQLSTTASSFLLDMPFFILGGQASGAALSKMIPGFTRLAAAPIRFGNLPTKAATHIAQNLGMLSIVETPRMVQHTLEGGTDALLDDIKQLGEFAVLAGSFGTLGEYIGAGASKLLQKPKMLQLNQAAQFLRRNPQVVKTAFGGITSGMLGYVVGGETFEEKLATGLTFASMHFASRNAWKSYIKGKKKSIMTENNTATLREIKTRVEQGADLETALRDSRAGVPDYYYRDGNKLYKIDKDVFVTKGEIELIPESQHPVIELTPELARRYRYITEIPPTAKITMKQALAQGKIEQIAGEIQKGIPKNPYNQETQKDLYESYEYGRDVLSNIIGSEIYSQKLYSIFRRGQLPDEPTLNKMIVDLTKNWNMSLEEIKSKIYPNIVRYFGNPTQQREFYQAEGGITLPAVITKEFDADMAKAVKQAIDTIVRTQKVKQIAQTASPMRVAQRIPEKASVQPPTEGRVYYDLNGEIIPLDRYNEKENKAIVENIEFTPKKVNLRTEEQIKLPALGSKVVFNLGKETVEATVSGIRYEKNEVVVRDAEGKQLVISPNMIKEVKSGEERVGEPENINIEERGETAEASRGNRSADVEGKEQPSRESYEEAQKILSGETSTPEVINRARELFKKRGLTANEFTRQFEDYLQLPNNQARLKDAKDENFERGLIMEDFARRIVASDLIGEKDITSDLYGKITSQIEAKPSQTHTEAPQGTIPEKPIVTPTPPEKVSPRASKEEIFKGYRSDKLEKSAEALTSIFEPKTAGFRNAEGKIKPEIIQRLDDIESKAAEAAKELSELTGEKVKTEDLMIAALKPYYTAKEIGQMFSLKNIYSEDAKRNENFINNRIKNNLKKWGLEFSKPEKPESVSTSEAAQAGLIRKAKPKLTPQEIEKERIATEEKLIQEARDVQTNITTLLKEKNAKNTSEERKKEIDKELQQLYKAKQDVGRKIAETTSDDVLFESERPNIQTFRTSPEERQNIEKDLGKVIPNIAVEWDAILPTGRLARTYVDKNGKVHIDFGNLISARTPLHEKIHAQALLAKDQATVEKVLKELNPEYDGNYGSESWRIAHERLVENAMRSQKDKYGLVDKLRETWEKLRNFFTNKGWYSTAEFYRRLLENKLDLDVVTKTFREPLYSTEQQEVEQIVDKTNKYRKDELKKSLDYTEKERFSDPRFPPVNEAGTSHRQLSELEEWEAARLAYDSKSLRFPFSFRLKNNAFVAKAGKWAKAVYNAAIQDGNLAYQRDKNGNFVNKQFKNLYDIANKMVMKTAEHFNVLYKNPDGWNESRNFRNLSFIERDEYVGKKLKKYYMELSDGLREPIERKEGETLENFVKRFGKEINMTEKEIEAEIHTQRAVKQMYEHGKEITANWWKDSRDNDGMYNATAALNKTEIIKFFGKDFIKDKSERQIQREMKEAISGNEKLRTKIAEHISEKLYPGYNTIYHNMVRPADPNYYYARGKKPSDNPYHSEVRWDDLRPGKRVHLDYKIDEYEVRGAGKEKVKLARINERGLTDEPFELSKEEYIKRVDKWDKYFTYGENEKKVMERVNEYVMEGYSFEEIYQPKQAFAAGQYNKLTANQLQALIDAGHIPRNDQIIKALQDAIKTSKFEQHTIKREYIKGMHFTPLEYEIQVQRFAQEAVASSTRRIYLQMMRDYLESWDKEIQYDLTSPTIPNSLKERISWLRTYGNKFYNKMAHSDQSWIDGMRKATTAFYLGIKPSFPFQQLFQNVQKGLPEAIAETPNAWKHWTNAYDKAFKLAYYLHGERRGEEVKSDLPQELIDLYRAMENRNLMAATGIKELMGDKSTGDKIALGDARYHYASGMYRNFSVMQRIAGLTGTAAEKFTRLQTLSLAYNIGKEKGLTGKELVEYTAKKLQDIQDVWGALGRPSWSQPKIIGLQEQKTLKALTKSMYTFKTFALGNLGQYDRLMRNRKWTAVGAKLAIALGLGGVRSIPAATTLFAIVDLLSDQDTEYETYKLLDQLNQENGIQFGKMVSRGVFAQMGLDMTYLLGQNTAYATDLWAETRSQSAEGRILEVMLGAPYGLSRDVLDASKGVYNYLKMQIKNDGLSTEKEKSYALKNMQKMTPVFLRNILRAYNLATDGVEVRGETIVKSDDISWTDVFYKALSLSPLKVSEAYEKEFSGTESKLTRAKGRISELKKIRREITQSKDYSPEVKREELIKVRELIVDAQKEQAKLEKQLKQEKLKTAQLTRSR